MKTFSISIVALAAIAFFLTVSCEEINLSEEMMTDPTQVKLEIPVEEPYAETYIEEDNMLRLPSNPVEEEPVTNDTLWYLEN